jgi:hypothetical protein
MSGGKGGGGEVKSPDPLAVAGADFMFNRQNQLTPYSNLNYYAPGQATGPTQQVGFNPDFLTSSANELFRGLGSSGYQGGGQVQTPSTPRANISSASSAIPQSATGKAGRSGPGGGSNVIIPTAEGRPITANYGGMQNATAVQTLSPAMLALENAKLSQTANTLSEGLRRQNEVANGALPELISGLNTSGLGAGQVAGGGLPSGQVSNGGGLPGMPTNPQQFQEGITRSMYDLGSRQMDRTFNRDFETIEQRLANQGLALGGEAGSRVMSDFFNERNSALGDLASRSVLAGGQEASRAINDITGLRSQGFAEQGQTFGQTEQQRQARLQEQVQNANLAQSSRIAGLNELNTLLGLPQVQAPGIQSFFGSSPTGVTDAFGLNLAGQNAKASLNNQLKGSQLGALTDLGTAGILMG